MRQIPSAFKLNTLTLADLSDPELISLSLLVKVTFIMTQAVRHVNMLTAQIDFENAILDGAI